MLLTTLTVLALTALARGELGSCPPTLPVDVKDAQCGPEKPCTDPKLCCPTWQGGSMCVDPVTRRHFVTLVKQGRCPEQPRGPWICSDACTGDSDCPRALKCCRNRCGALACQKPDPDAVTIIPETTTTTIAPEINKPLFNPEGMIPNPVRTEPSSEIGPDVREVPTISERVEPNLNRAAHNPEELVPSPDRTIPNSERVYPDPNEIIPNTRRSDTQPDPERVQPNWAIPRTERPAFNPNSPLSPVPTSNPIDSSNWGFAPVPGNAPFPTYSRTVPTANNPAYYPAGSFPSGTFPSGSYPSGSFPGGSFPTGSFPTGSFPSRSFPEGSFPSGSFPTGSFPSGSFPTGSFPTGSLPTGSSPSGYFPSEPLPAGSSPSTSFPAGSLPAGTYPTGTFPISFPDTPNMRSVGSNPRSQVYPDRTASQPRRSDFQPSYNNPTYNWSSDNNNLGY